MRSSFNTMTLGFMIVCCQIVLANDTKPDPASPIAVTVHLHSTNTNTNRTAPCTTSPQTAEDAIGAEGATDSYLRCLSLDDMTKLKACMNCLSHEEFYKALLNMNNRAREFYYDQLDYVERRRVRRDITEEQWALLAQKDPDFTKKIDIIVEYYIQRQRSWF
jgi:hypothetical protein